MVMMMSMVIMAMAMMMTIMHFFPVLWEFQLALQVAEGPNPVRAVWEERGLIAV